MCLRKEVKSYRHDVVTTEGGCYRTGTCRAPCHLSCVQSGIGQADGGCHTSTALQRLHLAHHGYCRRVLCHRDRAHLGFHAIAHESPIRYAAPVLLDELACAEFGLGLLLHAGGEALGTLGADLGTVAYESTPFDTGTRDHIAANFWQKSDPMCASVTRSLKAAVVPAKLAMAAAFCDATAARLRLKAFTP